MTSLDDCTSFMQASNRPYTYGHIIIVSDKNQAVIIENDIDGHKKNSHIRTATSDLSGQIMWSNQNAVCSVNAFVLDNESNTGQLKGSNKVRWEAYDKLMDHNTELTIADMASILNEKEVRLDWRQQSVIFDHDSKELYVDFRQVMDDDLETLDFIQVIY